MLHTKSKEIFENEEEKWQVASGAQKVIIFCASSNSFEREHKIDAFYG